MLRWGVQNQVLFDKGKSGFAVIHGSEGDGDDFRLLGSWFDTALRMETNVSKIVGKARSKSTALLRSKRYYGTNDMVHQFKTHVLCHLELNTGGFYHALDTVLDPLDRVQDHFVKEINLTAEMAFIEYNLAPLSTRRDIAMLGLIFKCVHGQAHQDLQHLFPLSEMPAHGYPTRLKEHRHEFQLKEDRVGTKHALLRRSVFGLTRVWNRLPREAVAAKTVTDMQKCLTSIVRAACRHGASDWAHLLSPRPVILKETAYMERLLYAERPLLNIFPRMK